MSEWRKWAGKLQRWVRSDQTMYDAALIIYAEPDPVRRAEREEFYDMIKRRVRMSTASAQRAAELRARIKAKPKARKANP